MLAEEKIRKFVGDYVEQRRRFWSVEKSKLPLAARRGEPSPILKFYNHADKMCSAVTIDQNGPVVEKRGSGSVPQTIVAGFVRDVNKVADEKAKEKNRNSEDQNFTAAINQCLKRAAYKNSPEVQAFCEHVLDTGEPATAIRDASKILTTQFVTSNLGVASAGDRHRADRSNVSEATWEMAWEKLRLQVAASKKSESSEEAFGCSSLIYVYWLDEAGISWAVERAAFRIENANAQITRKWPSLNARSDSALARVLATFTTSWQRGDLAAVQERQQMYYSLYGYPLFIAARGRKFSTPDPRHRFPAALNGLLHAAMRYYQEERNLEMLPNNLAASSAFRSLALVLREGNQNMRDIRPPELRAQFEYLKQVLGGDIGNSETAGDWDQVLQGRPGLRDGVARYVFNADAIAEIHGWRRTMADNYRILAEQSELILVIARAFDKMGASDNVALVEVFLQLMRTSMQTYVDAYKIVCGVDLEKADREHLMKPPAAFLARNQKPPVDAPWPRYWEPSHSIPAE